MRFENWKALLSKTRQRSVIIQTMMQIDLHPAQVRFIDRRPHAAVDVSLYTSVLATGRRWGKTELVAVDALDYAFWKNKSRQCITSVSLDQAKIAWERIVEIATSREPYSFFVREIKGTPFPLLVLENDSMITARSTTHEGKYLRGHKYDRVFIDEAEYVSEAVISDVVRMTLADVGGEMILTTTPRRRGSYVHRQYMDILSHNSDGYAQTGSSFENPYIRHDYIHAMRSRMTDEAWQREVEGIWTSGERAIFAWDDIQQAYLSADWEIPESYQDGKRYIAGWDLAKEQDWTVGIVLDATQLPLRVVYFDRFQQRHWQDVVEIIRHVHERYRCAATVIDATGLGDVVMDMLGEIAHGFVFTKESKTNAVYNLQMLLQQGNLRFPFIRELVDELNAYEWNDKGLRQDCVMSLAIACWTAFPHRARFVRPEDILLEVRR